MEENAIRFDCDPEKNRENLRKHGVRFETASLVFEDPWILSQKDDSHSESEERFNAIGEIAPGVDRSSLWLSRGANWMERK